MSDTCLPPAAPFVAVPSMRGTARSRSAPPGIERPLATAPSLRGAAVSKKR